MEEKKNWEKDFCSKFTNVHYDSIGWTGKESPEFYLKAFINQAVSKAYNEGVESQKERREMKNTKKICIICHQSKPVNDFYKSKKGYYSSQCKICDAIRTKEWRHRTGRSKRYVHELPHNSRDELRKFRLGRGTIERYGKVGLRVYQRAQFMCEQCDEDHDLTIHHKDNQGRNYERMGLKANNNIDNLMILCRRCHGSLHGKKAFIS